MMATKMVTERRIEKRERWLSHLSFEKNLGNRKTTTPLQPNPSMASEIEMKTKW